MLFNPSIIIIVGTTYTLQFRPFPMTARSNNNLQNEQSFCLQTVQFKRGTDLSCHIRNNNSKLAPWVFVRITNLHGYKKKSFGKRKSAYLFYKLASRNRWLLCIVYCIVFTKVSQSFIRNRHLIEVSVAICPKYYSKNKQNF